MAGNDAAQTSNSEDLTPVSRQGLGFTTTLPFGSTQLHQAWQTGLVWTSTFTISILVWRHSPSHQPYLLHSLTQAACNPTFADHGMTASVAGSLVNVGTATAVIDVNGTTLASTAPFVLPNRMNSAPEQLLHLGTNASGVEAVSRSPKTPYLKNDVNSVQLFCLVLVLRSSYSVLVNVVVSLASDIFYCGQFRVNEPPISSTTGNSITGAVQQDLVPPFRVTPPPPLLQINCRGNFVFTLIKEKWILWFLVLLLVFFLALILRRYCCGLRPRICHQRHFTLLWLISVSSQNLRKVA